MRRFAAGSAVLLLAVLGTALISGTTDRAAAAPTWVVDNAGDEVDATVGDGLCVSAPTGACTLRAAIQEANAGVPGTYEIGFDPVVTNVSLSLAGAGGDDQGDLDLAAGRTVRVVGNRLDATSVTTVAATGLGDRVFEVPATTELDLVLVTLTGGDAGAGDGGAVLNAGTLLADNSTATDAVTYSAFSTNGATRGGAIFNDGGSVTITNALTETDGGITIDSNTATGDGGAIYNDAGTFTVSTTSPSDERSVAFTGNWAADDGAAVRNGGTASIGCGTEGTNNGPNSSLGHTQRGGLVYNAGTLTLAGDYFGGNYAFYGGLLYNDASGTATLPSSGSCSTRSLGNGSEVSGGVIYNLGAAAVDGLGAGEAWASAPGGVIAAAAGTLDLTNSFVFTSIAPTGGFVAVSGTAAVTVSRSTFALSQTDGGPGGAFYVTGGTLDVVNSTISNNDADGGGAALAVEGGAATLRYTTVADNASGILATGGSVTLQRSLLASNDTNCSGSVTPSGDDFNVADDASCSPTGTDFNDPSRFSIVGQFLPGLEATPSGYYVHVPTAYHPAVDFVTAPGCDDPAIDEPGNARPSDGTNDGQAFCDAGAVEADLPGRTISGTVFDESTGEALQSVCVIATGPAGVALRTLTGSDGTYVLAGLPAQYLLAFVVVSPTPPSGDTCQAPGYDIDGDWTPEWYRNVAFEFTGSPSWATTVFPPTGYTQVDLATADATGLDACLGPGPDAGFDAPCPFSEEDPTTTTTTGASPSTTTVGASTTTTTGASTTTTAAGAPASAPSTPGGTLPFTGLHTLLWLTAGSAALATGGAAALAGRRRRRVLR